MLRTITVCFVLCLALNQVVARPQTSPARQFSEVTSTDLRKEKCYEVGLDHIDQSRRMVIAVPMVIMYNVYEALSGTEDCIRSAEAGIITCGKFIPIGIAKCIVGAVGFTFFAIRFFLEGIISLTAKCILGIGNAQLVELVQYMTL